MEEKVSVIVPVYNSHKYLKDCIDSLRKQSYKNLEIILIDDGSTDQSTQICDEYKEKDSRIRVIHQSNQGLSGARNRGIQEIAGEWLLFVDSDDVVSEAYVEKLYRLAVENHVKIAACGFQRFYAEKEETIADSKRRPKKFSKKEALSILNQNGNDFSLQMVLIWNKIYHKQIFRSLRFPVGRWHEDEFMAHKILNQEDYLMVTDEKLYFYRQHQDSYMGRTDFYSEPSHLAFLDALEERIYFFGDSYPDLLNGAMHRYALQTLLFFEGFRSCKKENGKYARKVLKKYRKILAHFYFRLNYYEQIHCGVFAAFPITYSELQKRKRKALHRGESKCDSSHL